MKNQDTITMYDYILEEKQVLLNVIENRKTICGELIEVLKEKKVEEIIISGSGTSYHAGFGTRKFIEDITGIRTRAEYPSVFADQQKLYSENTLFIGISQGGNSVSTAQAMAKVKENHVYTVGISENEEARIFENSDLRIMMNCGPELSIAKTKGYIVSLALLFVLGLEYGLSLGTISRQQYDSYIAELRKTADNYDNIIEAGTRWTDKISSDIVGGRRIIVLGYGNNYATTLEGALKLLECLRFGIYGYEIEEFCHGIYNSIGPETRLLYIGASGKRQERVPVLYHLLGETTAHQYVICNEIEGYQPGENDCQIAFVDHEYFNVLEYIVPIQIIASKLPYQLGIDPFYASDTKFHQKAHSK